MIPHFKVPGHWLTLQATTMTQKSGNRDLSELRKVRLRRVRLSKFFFQDSYHEFYVQILIPDDIFMHSARSGRIGSGQPVVVLSGIHSSWVSTTTDSFVTCFEGTKTTS